MQRPTCDPHPTNPTRRFAEQAGCVGCSVFVLCVSCQRPDSRNGCQADGDHCCVRRGLAHLCVRACVCGSAHAAIGCLLCFAALQSWASCHCTSGLRPRLRNSATLHVVCTFKKVNFTTASIDSSAATSTALHRQEWRGLCAAVVAYCDALCTTRRLNEASGLPTGTSGSPSRSSSPLAWPSPCSRRRRVLHGTQCL